jgi:hypothetical protein
LALSVVNDAYWLRVVNVANEVKAVPLVLYERLRVLNPPVPVLSNAKLIETIENPAVLKGPMVKQ